MRSYKHCLLVLVSCLLAGCGALSSLSQSSETVLVAGATGRTGSAIRQELKRQGYQVIGMTRSAETARQRFGEEWSWVEADVKDADAVGDAMHDVDYVISAIGARNRDGPDGPEFVDYGGVRHLAEAASANGVKHFVLISSAAAGIHRKKSRMIQIGNIRYWKTMGENALKRSGVPYTVIGPGGLENTPATQKGLRILTRKDYVTGLIATGDVAELAVAALKNPDAKSKTFAVIWDENVSRQTWPKQLQSIPEDALTEESDLEDPPELSLTNQ